MLGVVLARTGSACCFAGSYQGCWGVPSRWPSHLINNHRCQPCVYHPTPTAVKPRSARSNPARRWRGIAPGLAAGCGVPTCPRSPLMRRLSRLCCRLRRTNVAPLAAGAASLPALPPGAAYRRGPARRWRGIASGLAAGCWFCRPCRAHRPRCAIALRGCSRLPVTHPTVGGGVLDAPCVGLRATSRGGCRRCPNRPRAALHHTASRNHLANIPQTSLFEGDV